MMTVAGLTSNLSRDEPPTRLGRMAATGESNNPLATTAPPPSLQEQRASRRSPLVDNGDNDDDDNDNSLGLTLLYAGGIVREAVKDGGRYVGGRQRTTAEGGSLVVKGGGVENWLLSGGEQLMCG